MVVDLESQSLNPHTRKPISRMKTYDYLIVGSGLFGATFAHLAQQQGKRCLVVERRPHTGGKYGISKCDWRFFEKCVILCYRVLNSIKQYSKVS